MKVENITLTNLTASEDMWLTNGQTFGKTVLLGINDKADNWREVSEEEKQRIEKEIEDGIPTE